MNGRPARSRKRRRCAERGAAGAPGSACSSAAAAAAAPTAPSAARRGSVAAQTPAARRRALRLAGRSPRCTCRPPQRLTPRSTVNGSPPRLLAAGDTHRPGAPSICKVRSKHAAGASLQAQHTAQAPQHNEELCNICGKHAAGAPLQAQHSNRNFRPRLLRPAPWRRQHRQHASCRAAPRKGSARGAGRAAPARRRTRRPLQARRARPRPAPRRTWPQRRSGAPHMSPSATFRSARQSRRRRPRLRASRPQREVRPRNRLHGCRIGPRRHRPACQRGASHQCPDGHRTLSIT